MMLLFEISLYSVIVIGIVLVLGSSLYDIRSITRRRRLSVASDWRLHVTVLIYAQNDTATIDACLRSIVAAQLSDYDIVVVDTLSSDGTARTVRDYQRIHAEVPLRLYVRRVASDRQAVLRQAYRRSQHGDLVLVLDANSVIDGQALRSMVLFSTDKTLRALRFTPATSHTPQLSSVVRYFTNQSVVLYLKASELLRPAVVPFGCSGCAYRMLGRAGRRIVPNEAVAQLDSGVVEMLRSRSVSVASDRLQSRDWIVLAMVGWSVVLGVWVAQLAATLQTSQPLLVVWLAVVVWMAIVVMSDERMNSIGKLSYLFYIPVFSLITYVHIVLQQGVVVLYRAVRMHKE